MKKNIVSKIVFFAAFSAFLSLSFGSCSKSKSGANYSYTDSAEAPMMRTMGVNSKMAAKSMALEDAAIMQDRAVEFESAADNSSIEAGNNVGAGVQAEKKLIKTGTLKIETENLDKSNAAVEAWVKSYGGFVSNSSCTERNAWFCVKVPSANFEEAMANTQGIGKVLNHGTNVDDVSEQYYDLESRIKNKKIMKDKLEQYLKQAKDIKDLLQIERELNSVISNIDSMEGNLKRLSNQVQYSTININIVLPVNHDEHGFVFPDVKNGFTEFLSIILNFFVGLFKVVLLIVICGAPIVLIAALFFWLLFGKIGLLRKLFNKLKK